MTPSSTFTNNRASARRLPIDLNLSHQVRSIALINPLPDFGISQYTYELAEGLASSGVQVDVYANGLARFEDADLPRRHRYFPVLGSLLLRQRGILRRGAQRDDAAVRAAGPGERPASRTEPQPAGTNRRWRATARNWILTAELAWHLKRSRYDLVWTQWPDTEPGGEHFWSLVKRLGMRVAHTVHNVLPHEEQPGDARKCASVYRACDVLFVHSAMALEEMGRSFPQVVGKTRVMHHGLYTLYPRRPNVRDAVRTRLGIERDHVALLFFGGIRPYKNVDAVLAALAGECNPRAVLVVAGCESGYPESVLGDPLGRTRHLAEQLGVGDRVRLLPGNLNVPETADLFEAADVVILPYAKSYGSGALLLAMTFGKFIVATRTGGMDEYLRPYAAHDLLVSSETDEVAAGIERAIGQVSSGAGTRAAPMPDLQWSNIAKVALGLLRG